MRFFLICFLLSSISLFSQEDLLAKEYVKNGEFEKALIAYKDLYRKSSNNNVYFLELVKTHQQLEQLDQAEALLIKQIERVLYPALYVELGYNFQLKDNLDAAKTNYNIAINYLDENPNYVFSVAKFFENRTLLNEAIATYEKAMELKPTLNFSIQLATIYGEQGNIEKMFSNYLNFVNINNSYLNTIKRAMSDFISEDSENENNILLRRILLKNIQQEPNLLWNNLLSWLFIQQKEYNKAFAQEKAIFNRQPESLDRIEELAIVAMNDKDFNSAKTIFTYLAETAQNPDVQIGAHYNLLQIELKTLTDLNAIENTYLELFETFGKTRQTIKLQIAYAHFLGFFKHNPESATLFLKESLKLPISDLEEGTVKLELGDILVLQEKFNEALIYFTQIQRNLKNSTLAQEARFKVAQTSYYKGDFKWSESQLKILKSSTSQLIANDALDLMLLITDNKFEDSTQAALKLYAKADLMAFQNKPNKAIELIDAILENYKGQSIEAQALYKQGQLFETKQQFEKAIINYQIIIANFKDGILADDAYFALAQLHENELQNPVKAKEYYEQIIFNHQDSIYFVEARKKYRQLRGDDLN
ncbi:tetratricopeptide repeat protein [Bizionia argentinensis JUB59]|uniref:Tetratricopeptide repeat protein n=1 Tax=Bizionia argentinensis JUB59 TaxID=1046627 RepID=G2ECY1_9FLAO|nr:tetratricopeptide repeat protein [Bizionia argentinensis]EGV43748.2 tetratricopeptide repeat protein [Bizionia argentinensis JUB59]